MLTYDYIIKVSSAKMPSKCWGAREYVKIGLLECYQGRKPNMISDRDQAVKRVVAVYDKVHQGSTDR